MNVTIRDATVADLESILDIVNHSILHTTANYNYDIQSLETLKQWFLDKKLKQFLVIVAANN